MEDKKENTVVSVPYVVYGDSATHDRWIIKRLVIALIVTVVLMFLSNGLWLLAWTLYDYSGEETITTVDSEGDGVANYTGGDGGVTFGEGYGSQDREEADTE